ncbi:MAG: DNA polymerase III subunit delta [Desulfomonile tiedjei]|nr:DNA polymerase III subunit delta [Desulfomonile tiedjei]
MKKKIPDNSAAEGGQSLYLIFGDEFLVKERVARLVDEALDPELRGTNLIVLDGSTLDLGELSLQLFTPSLFGGSRVILVDQTTLFMGRFDQRKLVAKVLDAWAGGDRKSSFKALGQLLNLAGLDSSAIERGSDWISEVLGEGARPQDRDNLARAAQAFMEEGRKVGGAADESFLEELISSPFPEGTVLIFTAPEVDKRKKTFKVLEKRSQVIECAVREEKFGVGLEKSFFDQRVRDALKRAGKKISQEALETMYARSGKQLRMIHSEVEKLIGYVGDRKEISVKDVQDLFSDFHQVAFFELNNVLRTGDVKKCLPALYENLKIAEHPLQTLGLIASEMRKLMVAREMLFTIFRSSWKPGMQYKEFVSILNKVREENPALMAKGKLKLLSMKDYPLYLYLRDAQRFPMARLTRIMEAVLEADVMMKSTRVGSRSPETIVENLVLTICSQPHPKSRADKTTTLHR